MKPISLFIKNTGIKIACIILILFCGFFLHEHLNTLYDSMHAEEDNPYAEATGVVGRGLVDYAENVSSDNKILPKFQEQYPEGEVVSAYEEDLTNDGLKDLVVLFHPDSDNPNVHLVVVIDSGDSEHYICTEPISAPVENQKVKFQNIDNKDEIEFILQGQKDNTVGYGIFRVVDQQTVNLFSEGMADC